MYHAEKVINGVLHYKSTPRGDWYAYTDLALTERLMKAEEIIKTLTKEQS